MRPNSHLQPILKSFLRWPLTLNMTFDLVNKVPMLHLWPRLGSNGTWTFQMRPNFTFWAYLNIWPQMTFDLDMWLLTMSTNAVHATRWILTKSPRCDGINVHSLNVANQGRWSRSILLRSQSGVKLLNNALWLPNLVRRTPDWSAVQYWVQRSCGVRWGSTGGQIT